LTEQGAVLVSWGSRPGRGRRVTARARGEESGKWLHGIDQARQAVWETAWPQGTRAATLDSSMDREGDVYEVLNGWRR